MDLVFINPLFKWAVFLVASILSLFCAIMMVTRRNPIHSALWLIVAFFSVAVIYLTLGAQFIAVAQLIVYAGAIMMLIVFVIMLIHLESEMIEKGRFSGGKIIGSFITVILFLEIAAALLSFKASGVKAVSAAGSEQIGSVASVGTFLYGKYLFPFEIASILLLIGIIGAVVLARRRKD
ncbi:MAG: NADH-quinone oxidoreductase subunit J [Syntrophorhabdaceae bacterium PtaU1.Bin034]|nr:MAG: NADH-quinone oxidoreductase subunit J [Syntrophorhabdaceae bacterium PtaU1.Bin034]